MADHEHQPVKLYPKEPDGGFQWEICAWGLSRPRQIKPDGSVMNGRAWTRRGDILYYIERDEREGRF